VRRLVVAAAGLVLAAACIRSEDAPPPAPVGAEPQVRVGLLTDAAGVTVGAAGALTVARDDGSTITIVRAGETVRIVPAGRGLRLVGVPGADAAQSPRLLVAPVDAGTNVTVDGRPYRGTLQVLRDSAGLTVVNRLGLESYLAAVVAGEMGRRAPEDAEALRAQAIVSRTYALRNLGRWASRGFDLYATVSDQVYGGVSTEYALASDAVAATRGLIVTYGGAPIDAFFYSTCGGRTAGGTEVFSAANPAYLRSIDDTDPNGDAYCRISPRFRWTEEWTASELHQVLGRTLPAAGSSRVTSVRVTRISGSGRADELAVSRGGREVLVPHREIRLVLRTAAGDPLRSTRFTLDEHRVDGAVVRLAANGGGAGHGVGLCQWGAVGRSRAGQDYRTIIAAYYPNTTLERFY
jgi:stage II sporulation protein D